MFKPQRIIDLIENRRKKEKGFTKRQLASITGLTVKTIDDVSHAKTSTKVENLEIIAAAFGVDMNYFFDQFDGQETVMANTSNAGENPWKICYELQSKLAELEKELAQNKESIGATENEQ